MAEMKNVGAIHELPYQRLKDKLRELFQFDLAELDFGIYRILNYKRKEIGCFIEHDLITAIEKGVNGSKKTWGRRNNRDLERTQ